MSEYETERDGWCSTGGPHYFRSPDRCQCGTTEGYVVLPWSEYERLVKQAQSPADPPAGQDAEAR